MTLLGEIKTMGYSGSRASFYRLIAMWKQRDRHCSGSSTAALHRGALSQQDPDESAGELPVSRLDPIDPATGHLISPIAAAALCIKPRGMPSRRQAIKVAVLKAASADFVRMRRMAMQFRAILRHRDPDLLMPWIDRARHCGLHGMQHFARTLLADLDAVRNAVSEPWSNGPVEGQNQPSQDDQTVDVWTCRSCTPAAPDAPIQSANKQQLMRQTPYRAI